MTNTSEKVIIRPKHREVFKKITENDRLTIEQAKLEVGYAKSYTHLAETDSWQQLMKEYLPDEELAKKHKELLDKKEVIKWFNHTTGEMEMQITKQPDGVAVPKALDMGYRLKGKYAAEKHININIPVPLLGGDSIKNENNSNRKTTDAN